MCFLFDLFRSDCSCMHISLPENGRKDQVCVLGRVRLAGTCTVPALPWRVWTFLSFDSSAWSGPEQQKRPPQASASAEDQRWKQFLGNSQPAKKNNAHLLRIKYMIGIPWVLFFVNNCIVLDEHKPTIFITNFVFWFNSLQGNLSAEIPFTAKGYLSGQEIIAI